MSPSSSISSGLSLQSSSSSEQEWNFDHVPDGPPEALVGSDGDLPLTDGEDDLGFLLEGELKSESEDDLHPWANSTSSDEEEEEEEVEEEEEDDSSSSSAGYPPAKRFHALADSEDDDDDEEEEAPAEGWGSSDEELEVVLPIS